MDPDASEPLLLRDGPARSVLLDRSTRPPTVRKRFHHPRRLAALLDGRRARRELALLEHLHARGVAVPRPLGLARGARGWEVRMAWIEGGRPLAALLRRPDEPPPGGWRRLLRALGRLLAALEAAGVEHADLHPGNALVDASGRPFLLDFHAARRRRGGGGEDALARCAGAAREALSASERVHFLAAWHRARGRAGAAPPPLAALGRRVEEAARGERRAAVLANLDRWLRASSRCTAHEEGRLLVRRGVAPEAARAARDAGAGVRILGREAEARWLAAARLREHGLPALAPLALWRGPEPLALFEPPEGASGAPGPGASADAPALAALLGALHERGLDLAPLAPDALARGPRGEPCLLPPRALAALDPLDERLDAPRRFRALDRLVPPGRRDAAFVRAYAAAFAAWPEEARTLRARLGGPGARAEKAP